VTTPLLAWEQLRAGNQSVRTQPPDRPIAAVFRCSDARLSNEEVFRQPSGSLIDVSTWGHTVDSSVLASLEYAVDALEVPLIVVLGHDDCPAMNAALRAWENAELPTGSMRTAVEHALLSVVRRGAVADSAHSVATAHVVETGAALLQRSPSISIRIDSRDCGIVCATYGSIDRELRVHATFGAVTESTDALVEIV
jgi:carbonic anhydrase